MLSRITGSHQKVLDALMDDDKYYGSFGSHWLSASALQPYYDSCCPKGREFPPEAALFGRWYHGLMLEPEKYTLDDAPEAHRAHLDALTATLMKHPYWKSLLKKEGFKTEIPYTGSYGGVQMKCKVDIETDNKIYDIKTTSSLNGYEFNSKKIYKYPMSAYQYFLMTGKTMVYIIVEKKTGKIKVHETDPDYYLEGRAQWMHAMRNYKESLKREWIYLGDQEGDDEWVERDNQHKVFIKRNDNKLYAFVRDENNAINKRQ